MLQRPYQCPLISTLCWHVHCQQCWTQSLVCNFHHIILSSFIVVLPLLILGCLSAILIGRITGFAVRPSVYSILALNSKTTWYRKNCVNVTHAGSKRYANFLFHAVKVIGRQKTQVHLVQSRLVWWPNLLSTPETLGITMGGVRRVTMSTLATSFLLILETFRRSFIFNFIHQT